MFFFLFVSLLLPGPSRRVKFTSTKNVSWTYSLKISEFNVMFFFCYDLTH